MKSATDESRPRPATPKPRTMPLLTVARRAPISTRCVPAGDGFAISRAVCDSVVGGTACFARLITLATVREWMACRRGGGRRRRWLRCYCVGGTARLCRIQPLTGKLIGATDLLPSPMAVGLHDA
jgi:hypothetical protein